MLIRKNKSETSTNDSVSKQPGRIGNPRRASHKKTSVVRKQKKADKERVSFDNEEAVLFDTGYFSEMVTKGQTFDMSESDKFDQWISSIFLESFKSKSNEVKYVHISPEYARVRFPRGRSTHELLHSLQYPLPEETVGSQEIAKEAWNVSDIGSFMKLINIFCSLEFVEEFLL